MNFFDDFDWESAGGVAMILSALALAILAPVLAIVCENIWLLLLWVPAILCVSVLSGKGWF